MRDLDQTPAARAARHGDAHRAARAALAEADESPDETPWKGRDAFIGECKIWAAQKAFRKGLTQLLELYTVWRATRLAMILFIRDRADYTAIIDKARHTIEGHPRFIRPVPSTDPHAFEVRAQRDAARVVTMYLVPVVLPRSPRDPRGPRDR